MPSRKSLSGTIVALVLTASGIGVGTGSAEASTTGAGYHQQGRVGGGVASYAHFGSAADTVLVGDWDGDGIDTLAVRRGYTYYVSNSPSGGATSYSFGYGSAKDVVLVGDWNGDGVDTLGVRRGNSYYLTDNPRGGAGTHVFKYGNTSDAIIVGDWNGDGRSTLGVRRGYTYYLTDTEGGVAQTVARFGTASDVVFTGDWNADGKDSLGVRRGSSYYLANAISGGRTNVTETFGAAVDSVYIGDWNGDGTDTLAVRRSSQPTVPGDGSFAVGTHLPRGLYKGAAPADGCYWERVRDFSGDVESINANYFGFNQSPLYVEITTDDAGFNTDGCARWVMAFPTDSARYVSVRDGQYRVGKDIRTGRYQAPGGDDCYWATLSSFRGDVDSVSVNGYGDSGPIVDVSSADVGFQSESCGTWTRLGPASSLATTRERTVEPDRLDIEATRRAAARAGALQGR
jgi:hypothetical protein